MGYKKHPVELLGDAYLRVYTPKTSDGRTPKIVNGIQQFREDHLPLTARKHIERKNRKLPEVLQKKIEVVNADIPVMQVKAAPPIVTKPEAVRVEVPIPSHVPEGWVGQELKEAIRVPKPVKPKPVKKSPPKKPAKVKPAEAEKPLI